MSSMALSVLIFITLICNKEVFIEAHRLTPHISISGQDDEHLNCSLDLQFPNNLTSEPRLEWGTYPQKAMNRDMFAKGARVVGIAQDGEFSPNRKTPIHYNHAIEIVDANQLSGVTLICNAYVVMGFSTYKSPFLSIILAPTISVSGKHGEILNCSVVLPPTVPVRKDPEVVWGALGHLKDHLYVKAFKTLSKGQDVFYTEKRPVTTYHHTIEILDSKFFANVDLLCGIYIEDIQVASGAYHPRFRSNKTNPGNDSDLNTPYTSVDENVTMTAVLYITTVVFAIGAVAVSVETYRRWVGVHGFTDSVNHDSHDSSLSSDESAV